MKKVCGMALLFSCYFMNAQTTVDLNATRDNTIYSESGSTSNGAGSYLFAGVTGNGNTRRSLIYFNLSGIPAGATITAVTLKITCSKAASGSGGLAVHKMTHNWGEGGSDAGGEEGGGAPAQENDATWTVPFFNKTGTWGSTGGDFVSTPSATVAAVSSGNKLEIASAGLLQDVQDWVNNSPGNFGWALLGSENTERSSRRYNSRHNAQDPPVLSVTYTGTLPVHLISFRAIPEKNAIRLEWQAAGEINFKQFEIEHSKDAINFSRLDVIPADGSPVYTGYHHTPSAGKNFYRLKMMDIDGKSSLSKVISGFINLNTTAIIWPNPASGQLQVTATEGFIAEKYIIYDLAGKSVQTGVFSASAINVGDLSSGQYLIRLYSKNGETSLLRFFKH